MGKIQTLSKDLLEHWDQTHPMQLPEVSVPNLSFLYEEAMGRWDSVSSTHSYQSSRNQQEICTRTLTSGGWERKMTPACSLPTQEQQTSPEKGDIQAVIAFDAPKFYPALFLSNKKAQYPMLIGFFTHK